MLKAYARLLGLPKPIVTNHATWAVTDNDRNLPAVKGRENANYALWNFPGSGGRYFAGFPPFDVSSGAKRRSRNLLNKDVVARWIHGLSGSTYLLYNGNSGLGACS